MYLVLWSTAPVLAFGFYYRAVAVLAAVVWLVLEFGRRDGIVYRPGRLGLLAVFYVGYTVLVSHFFDTSDDLTRQLSTYICIFFLILYEGIRRLSVDLLRPAVWAVLLTYPIWCVATLVAYQLNSNISRVLVRSSEEAVAASAAGIGGYAFVYSLVFLVPMLLYLLLRTRIFRKSHETSGKRIKRKRLKIFLIASNVLLGTIVVLLAGYTLAVILLTIGVVLALMPNSEKRIFVVAFSTLVLVAVVASVFSSEIKGQLIQMAKETAYAVKVQDVILSAESDETIGTVSDRARRYVKSITAFSVSPILGSLRWADVGKHSPILDNLGQYGVIIGLLFAYLYLAVPARFLADKSTKPLSIAIFSIVLLLLFLNNIPPAVGVMIFLVYPVVREYSREWR